MLHGTGAARDFGHGGGAPGMEASLLIHPEPGWVVVGLSNESAGTAGAIVQFIGNRLPL